MVKLITIQDVATLIEKIGLSECLNQLIEKLNQDYARWDDFSKSPRHVTHFTDGVIELMPICDDQYYAYKFVNGHPKNPQQHKMTVVAVGMLADSVTGYPLMISEMTLLTAIRTAAASALAAKYLAKKNSQTLGIIGTGSQAEFQVLAHQTALGINTVKYFDIDPQAMQKFAHNLKTSNLQLIPCKNAAAVMADVDVIITATADRARLSILKDEWVMPGLHINGVGGDCAGKTELDPRILERSKIVVEYLEQTKIEGEIQHLDESAVYAQLWELCAGKKLGRENNTEITLFDSVGFALEDYSILSLFYQWSEVYGIGADIAMVPTLEDPKNLFSLLHSKKPT